MRRLLVLVLAASASACVSPRKKDCAALVPLVREASAARDLAVGDAGLGAASFAERPSRAAAALHGVVLRDQALMAPAARLAEAMDRFAAAMKSLDELVDGLRLDPGARVDASAYGRAIEEARPHVEHLLRRCATSAGEECTALRTALERCVSPERDDTTAEELLLACAGAVEAVRSDDARTAEAVSAVTRAVRSLEPLARRVRAPAKEVLALAERLRVRIDAQARARADAAAAEHEIGALCQPLTSGPP